MAALRTKLSFFLIVFLSFGTAYSQEDTLHVRDFIEFQHAGKFQDALNLTDAEFQTKVNAQTLAQIWQSLIQQFGEYKGIQQLEALKKGTFTVLNATVEYNRALVVLQHTLNPAR